MTIYGATAPDTPRFDDRPNTYDALLVLSFGGPEGPEDVIPFLENVTSGRNVPRARLEEVAGHYLHFDGVSPINAQNRALIAALETELALARIDLPVYFGNRNWYPFVTDTVREMHDDGVERALVFVTSAFSSYSGCRQYREDLIGALATIETRFPEFDKLRVFYNHPGYVKPMIELTRCGIEAIPAERRSSTRLIFTAHSIPMSMARHCSYDLQFREASGLIAQGAGFEQFMLAYQSRSGSPHAPWLEPDILDVMRAATSDGVTDVVIVPVGFISDHMEVMFDLDTEARELADELGLGLVRVPTVGTHPRFIRMIRELIVERMTESPDRPALGRRGPGHDICPVNCCQIGSPR